MKRVFSIIQTHFQAYWYSSWLYSNNVQDPFSTTEHIFAFVPHPSQMVQKGSYTFNFRLDSVIEDVTLVFGRLDSRTYIGTSDQGVRTV